MGNFLALSSRTDIGALWENYLVIERMKLMNNTGCYSSGYFWRTIQRQEIDYIEEQWQKLSAFEFKWNAGKNGSGFQNVFKRISGGKNRCDHPG